MRKRYSRGVAVVEVRGKLVGTMENCEKFHDLVRSLFEEGVPRIVVDLTHTPWANSQGIGMLIGAYASTEKAGGHLVLTGVGTRIRDLLAVTRLYLIFETFRTADEAIDRLVSQPSRRVDDTAAEPTNPVSH